MHNSLLVIFGLLAAAAVRAELAVNGLDDDLERNVRAFAAITGETCDAPEWRVRRRFRALTKQAESALEAFGYYAPIIKSEISFQEECWSATLDIDPGVPVVFRTVDVKVSGEVMTGPIDEASNIPANLAPGQRLDHVAYDSFRDAIQVAAAEHGYVEARFMANELRIWPDELAADVVLHFESGPRYRFGEVSIEQNILDDELVARYLEIDFDEPYDAQVLTDAYKALSNSGYFSAIQIVPEFDQAENLRVPITVSLQPGDRIEYNIGAGFATDTGLRLTGRIRNRRFSEQGNRFDTQLQLSSVQSGLLMNYRRPLENPRVEWMSYSGAISTEHTDTSESDTARVGVRRTRRIVKNWVRTLSLDLDYERFIVGNADDDSFLVIPSLAIDHKDSDQDVNPRRGRRLRVELRGTDQVIGSSTSFLQVIGRARFILPAGEQGRFIARASAGFTAKDEFDDLPPSVRFFGGGDESVRGFDYESLGPKDVDGNVIGGSHLLVGSVEYERRIRGNFYGAVFLDGGNAFDGTDVDPAFGTGLGIKWRSPLGPLRFYVAHPLNKSDDDYKVHISLGADL